MAKKAKDGAKAKMKEQRDAKQPDTSAAVEEHEAVTPDGVSLVRVNVPLAAEPVGYVSRHIDVQLTHDQARTLTRVYRALDEQNARLSSGRRVNSRADAVRWMLEQLGGRTPARTRRS